mmetsp:Transcript_39892/g.68053  ORF Transcript_39892/g.68053 Transcript_39892/m.68053 type:complete len:88 (+) Transcript_39892:428-691(+)
MGSFPKNKNHRINPLSTLRFVGHHLMLGAVVSMMLYHAISAVATILLWEAAASDGMERAVLSVLMYENRFTKSLAEEKIQCPIIVRC